MKIFTEEVQCDVCGGYGVATPMATSERWLGASLVHSDPRVCQDNLKRRKEELDAREAKLNQRTG